MVFTIRENIFDIPREAVERVLESLEPELLRDPIKYYVEYKGEIYSIKQVVSAIMELLRIAFTAIHTYKILATELEVKELSLKRTSR